MKISTQARMISTALVALAIAAPVAYGGSGVYPELRTGEGFSFKAPSYWRTATPPAPMNRSLEVPPEYRLPDAAATAGTSPQPKIDPLAVSHLIGLGLTSGEVESWTAGGCSHRVKAESCYAMLEKATTPLQSVAPIRSDGFDWGDASIGAGAMLGILLLVAGMGAGLVASRQNRRREVAGA